MVNKKKNKKKTCVVLNHAPALLKICKELMQNI